MAVLAPTDTYLKMITYADKKNSLRWDQLFLQAFLSGYWICIYGHAILKYGGNFFDANNIKGIAQANLVFGLLFPGAFMALIYTGAELFTGNTVTMVLFVCQKGYKRLGSLARVWALSLVGNFIGSVACAYFFTYLTFDFINGSPGQQYLHFIADRKLSNNFGQNFVLAIGCNSLVCLATWCSVCSPDGAGKIMAMIYCVGVFVLGGYEHVIANMYLLFAAYFCGYRKYSIGHIFSRNLIPVFLGNVIAGTVFTGILWWYALHPDYTELSAYSEIELIRELSQRNFSHTSDFKPDSVGDTTGASENKWTTRWTKPFTKNNRLSALKPYHMKPSIRPSSNDLENQQEINTDKMETPNTAMK